VTSCRSYADRRARLKGDLLAPQEADGLAFFACLCSLLVPIRGGLNKLPDLG
jgi:hypothetical protein